MSESLTSLGIILALNKAKTLLANEVASQSDSPGAVFSIIHARDELAARLLVAAVTSTHSYLRGSNPTLLNKCYKLAEEMLVAKYTSLGVPVDLPSEDNDLPIELPGEVS